MSTINRKKKALTLQPFYGWHGHYSDYHESIIKNGIDGIAIFHGNNKPKYGFCARSIFPYYSNLGFIGFSIARLSSGIQQFVILIYMKYMFRLPQVIHFQEFEPLSAFLILMSGILSGRSIVQTIHSIEPTPRIGLLAKSFTRIHHYLYLFSIFLISSRTTFVVHSEYHKIKLRSLLGDAAKIYINTYPCPEVQSTSHKKIRIAKKKDGFEYNRFLHYGIVRPDKGIFEFIKSGIHPNMRLTIAGRLEDKRIEKINLSKNINIINTYISSDMLSELMNNSDFILLPYVSEYSGSAGPPRDAFAYGVPVIAKNIPIMEEIVCKKRGFLFTEISELIAFLKNLDSKRYEEMHDECLNYARKHTWNNFGIRYKNILHITGKCDARDNKGK